MKDGNKLPACENEARWHATVWQLDYWARYQHWGMKLDLEAERKQSGFGKAFQNFHAVFWKWVDDVNKLKENEPDAWQKIYAAENLMHFQTPDQKTPQDAEFLRELYQIWRAVYLDGLTHGERHNVEHVKHFIRFAEIAEKIDDRQILLASHGKWNYTPPKAQPRLLTDRQLKYCLLVVWLSAGLWRAESRDVQTTMLSKLFEKLSPTAEAISHAQKRLGLEW